MGCVLPLCYEIPNLKKMKERGKGVKDLSCSGKKCNSVMCEEINVTF